MSTNLPLITKYRPISFDEVAGNKEALAALQDSVRSLSCPHTYLFTGPSGTGKTTLARIVAKEVNAAIDEICAATNSGVEDTRRLVELSGFKPILSQKNKMFIIDECHNLSSKGWEPLLKLTEDPPPYLYIALATTEPSKVPQTMLTRCYSVALKPLKPNEMADFLSTICFLEKWTVNDSVIEGIIQAATGQPRKALSILQSSHLCTSKEELGKIISSVEVETNPAYELSNLLIRGIKNWEKIRVALTTIEDYDEACVLISRRLTAAMANTKTEKEATNLWYMIEMLSGQSGWDKKIQLHCAVGRIMWGK